MEDNDPRNVVHYFKSEREAMICLVMLARTANTGGKRCFMIDPHTDASTFPRKPTTYYKLVFLPKVWEKITNPKGHSSDPDAYVRTPPTVKEMAWFVRGYLRALTGVKPTVF